MSREDAARERGARWAERVAERMPAGKPWPARWPLSIDDAGELGQDLVEREGSRWREQLE